MTTRIECSEGTDWTCLTLNFPVLAVAVLEDLRDRIIDLANVRHPTPLILASAHPTIYLAGAHLGEIAGLDAVTSIEYAELGRSVIAAVGQFPAATIAAVHGSCSGGGFDLVLGCDRIVAGPSASFSHPGVRRGLVTGWGGTVSMPAAVGRPRANRALLQGANVPVDDLADLGIVTPVDGNVLNAAVEDASRLSDLHRGRLEMWRSLRGGQGDQMWRILSVRDTPARDIIG